jgi:hypothetical protein
MAMQIALTGPTNKTVPNVKTKPSCEFIIGNAFQINFAKIFFLTKIKMTNKFLVAAAVNVLAPIRNVMIIKIVAIIVMSWIVVSQNFIIVNKLAFHSEERYICPSTIFISIFEGSISIQNSAISQKP